MVMAMHCISVATTIARHIISCPFIHIFNSSIESSNAAHTISAATASDALMLPVAVAKLMQFHNLLISNALPRRNARDTAQK
jgi:hypothetical protein